MMHKAWSSIDEVPYCFSRSDDLSNFKVTQDKISTSYVKFKAYRGWKIDGLDLISFWPTGAHQNAPTGAHPKRTCRCAPNMHLQVRTKSAPTPHLHICTRTKSAPTTVQMYEQFRWQRTKQAPIWAHLLCRCATHLKRTYLLQGTVWKRSIRVKISDFLSCVTLKFDRWPWTSQFLSRVTLKFDGWPWKTIGHPSYAASSFVHHFIAIGKFKLELQFGNAQFGSN